MKLIKKLLIVVLCVFLTLPNYAKAFSLKETIDGANDFVSAGNNEESLFNQEEQEKGVSQIYYFALGIGIFASIVIGVIIGIQFITSGVEGKAKIKEKLIPYCIGCVVVFGALGIWRLTVNIIQDVF